MRVKVSSLFSFLFSSWFFFLPFVDLYLCRILIDKSPKSNLNFEIRNWEIDVGADIQRANGYPR